MSDYEYAVDNTYDFLGNVTSVTNPRAAAEAWSGETRTARYEYDIDGQVTKTTDIYGNYTINEYDGLGRLVRTAGAESTATSAPYYTTFTYDGNNLRQSKTTNGITTQHVWDGSNMVMDGTNKFYRGETACKLNI